MFCSRCGSEVSNDATFCGTCGAELVGSSTMPVAAAVDQTSVMPPMAGGRQGGSFQGGDWQPQEEPPKKGKVIAIIVVILVLMGAAAGATWYFMDQRYQAELQEANERAEKAASDAQGVSSSSADQSSESSSSATGSSASASPSSSGPASTASATTKVDSYVGTWTGEMTSTKSWASYNCYGATGHPLEVVITANETTGQINGEAKVLLHAHNMTELNRDVESLDADRVIEVKGLVGTFKNGSFEFKTDIDDEYEDGEMVFSFKTSEKNGERILICEVKRSGNYSSDTIFDTYELRKKS